MSRLALPQTHGSRRRPRPLSWLDPRLKSTIDGRAAKPKKWIAQPTISDKVKVTAKEYATFQGAFDYFNLALFDGTLPQVLITLQRQGRSLGYFCAERFRSRAGVRVRVHEIALNPEGFRGEPDEEILSTLVHEMTHLWQKEFGKAGRGRYHNRQFAAKMHRVGLMPSSTGKEGGAITGDSISHYILPEGPFISCCRPFVERYRLNWESAFERRRDGEGENRQTRAKFTCPNCGRNAWAQPSAKIDCHDCSTEAHEQIVMTKQLQ